MILKLYGLICTRNAVEQLASDNPAVTEVNFCKANVIGGSTMHQFICSFPSATFTRLEGWNKKEYEWVMQSIEDRNQIELWFLNQIAEQGGLEMLDLDVSDRKDCGLILTALGLVSRESFERDGLSWLRFTVTQLGLNVLKKHA